SLAPHPADWLARTAFLLFLTVGSRATFVTLDRGSLNLTSIPGQAAALQALPLSAAVIGLVSGLLVAKRDRPGYWLQVGGNAVWVTLPALVALALRDSPRAIAILAVVLASNAANILNTGINLAIVTQQPAVAVWRKGLNSTLLTALFYCSAAAVVLDRLIDGTPAGYCYALIVAGLAVALPVSLDGRRVQRMLTQQLTDADRYMIFSRVSEGVVHNVRNHLMAAESHLRLVDVSRLNDGSLHDLIEARRAVDAAVSALTDLSVGANPRPAVSSEALDMDDLVDASIAQVKPTSLDRKVDLRKLRSRQAVTAKGDPTLLREVLINLLLNAIAATPAHGTITVSLGYRVRSEVEEHTPYTLGAAGKRFVSISVHDSGPGVDPSIRERLFEPHFTTKAGGSGMGLFVSYGVIREHRGELLYEGSPQAGGVFTVLLPALES
ncbi:MAG: ATP-binding protein, partial [Chloroflexota bacterium]|nr:ATP-binding protein [Chloroflexota bacterium]